MKIEIEKNSGFCFGVVGAIEKAEEELQKNGKLYCLGDIVHNNMEMNRLGKEGLITIDKNKFKELRDCTVLIRAHGEPPETYEIAKKNNITLIDATCPVVLKLQKKIKESYQQYIPGNGQIIIYGKNGHAEVNGLVGQTNNEAIVVTGTNEISKIDFSKPISLFSQTTMSTEGFENIKNEIIKGLKNAGKDLNNIKTKNTTCKLVSNRRNNLTQFAKSNEVIIFVSGVKSSNGRMLYELCKSVNPQTHFISSPEELNKEWFENIDNVGICGATSSPKWLMEDIAKRINQITL